MIQQQGQVNTSDASQYLKRLCFHFSRKIKVSYDEHQGEAEFPWGHCQLKADASSLAFDCSAADPEQLARIRFAIDEHIKLFSRRAPMVVVWQEAVVLPAAVAAQAL
ncbi:MAG: DUF2218 domain-containing protein [Pseudomonadota bacterium]